MKENNAEGRKLTYVGFSAPAGPYSRTDDGHRRIICWYQDELGEYWHEHRILVDGKIVSSSVYFFGEEKDRPLVENEHMVPKAYKEGQGGFRKESRAAG